MWRPCSDLIFHHATTQSRISRKDRLRQKRPAAAKRPASFGQNHPRLRISVFWRIRGCGYGCIRVRFSHYRDYDYLLHAMAHACMLIHADCCMYMAFAGSAGQKLAFDNEHNVK